MRLHSSRFTAFPAPVPGGSLALTSELPAPTIPRAGGRHVPALDGLRGVAIILVLILHATEGLNRLHKVPALVKATYIGFTGVDLFFVLSGFLITGILLEAKSGPAYFRVFYTRRVLRIFPLYYAFLLLIFVVLPLFPLDLGPTFGELHHHQAWYWFYVSNVLNALQGGWRIDGRLTPHFWSLAVEEQFYLVWPAVVYLLSRRGLRNTCIGLVLTVPLLRLGLRLEDVNPVAVYVLTICRADALAIGALLAIVVRADHGPERLSRVAMPALLVSAAATALMGVWRGGFEQFDAVVGTAGYSVFAALYASALAVTITRPPSGGWLARAASVGWLRTFGKYSYAIYVFHQPITGMLEHVFPFEPLQKRIGTTAAGIGFFAAVIAISFLCALASWNLLERRFIALKDRFRYRVAVPLHAPTPAPVQESLE